MESTWVKYTSWSYLLTLLQHFKHASHSANSFYQFLKPKNMCHDIIIWNKWHAATSEPKKIIKYQLQTSFPMTYAKILSNKQQFYQQAASSNPPSKQQSKPNYLLTKDIERNPLQVTQRPNFDSIFYILTKLQHIFNLLPNGLNNLYFKWSLVDWVFRIWEYSIKLC